MAKRLKSISYYDRARMEMDEHYRYFMTRGHGMYASQRHWVNMGDYFDSNYAEACLFYQGWVTVWYDDIAQSYLCGRVIPGTKLDIYGNYTDWTVQTINGMHIKLDINNAVIIYDSSLRSYIGNQISRPVAPVAQIGHVVEEMCALSKSLRVNISSLGCPLIINGSADQQMSLNNQIKMYDAGTPYIFVNNDRTQGLNSDIKAMQTGAVNNIASFSTELSKCWSEMYNILGIDNVGVQKAERLTVDEVNSNNEQTNLVAYDKIRARNKGLAYLNAMYGTDCYVEGVNASVAPNPVDSNYSAFDYGSDEPPKPNTDPASGGDANG